VHFLEKRATSRTWRYEDAPRTQELGHTGEVTPLNGCTDVNAIKADQTFAIILGDGKAIAVDNMRARSCRYIGSATTTSSRVDVPRFLCAPRFQRILAVINYIAVNLNTCQRG
jgi:hypothetical protein